MSILTLVLPALLGALVVADLPAQSGTQFELRLEESGRVSRAGDSFGLILRTPHEKEPSFSVLEVVQLGQRRYLRWRVGTEASDGRVLSWFVVKGLTREEDVAGFLRKPQEWSWARVTEDCSADERVAGALRFTPKGAPILAHGRIAGPRGQPPLGLQYSVEELMESGEFGVTPWSDRCVVGVDPQSGRLWVQAPGRVAKRELFLSVDPFRRPELHLAGVFHVPLKKDEPLRIRIPREALLELKPTLPPQEFAFPIVARLIPSQAGGRTHESRDGQGWRLGSVTPGSYVLRITSQSPEDVFFEKKGLVLEEGKTLLLEDAFDVMPQLKPVTIQVVDERGQAVPAVIDQIFFSKNKHWLSRSPTSNDGVARRLVRKDRGGSFRVRARGWAPVLLFDLAADRRVVLQRPLELDVEVQGLPSQSPPSGPLEEDGDLEMPDQGFFVLRAEPSQGFSPRARSGLLQYTEQWSQGPGQPRRFERQVFCRARILKDHRARIRLLGAGSWRFSLWVSRRRRLRRFPLPDPVDLSQGQKKLTLHIPQEIADALAEFLRPGSRKSSGKQDH